MPQSSPGQTLHHLSASRRCRSYREKQFLKCCDLTHGNEPFCMKMEWKLGFGEQAQFEFHTMMSARLLLEDGCNSTLTIYNPVVFLCKHPCKWKQMVWWTYSYETMCLHVSIYLKDLWYSLSQTVFFFILVASGASLHDYIEISRKQHI